MFEKLPLYSILATVVPGSLAIGVVAALFPYVTGPVRKAALPSEFAFLVLLAAAMFAGQLIQTLGSLAEPLLFLLFGGRPSERALGGRLPDRYLPADASARIRQRLQAAVGGSASERSLFLAAMARAESTHDTKAAELNAQYGYHRALLALTVVAVGLLAASRWWGAAEHWHAAGYWTCFAFALALCLLLAWRTYQRGVYYAREVLLAAERTVNPTREVSPPV